MNDKKLWEEYKNIDNSIGNKYDVWSFGASQDKLLDLVLKGEKLELHLYTIYMKWKMNQFLKKGIIV